MPPETMLVYHTAHTPHRTANLSLWEADAFLPQHVAQINAAGREARRPRALLKPCTAASP